MTTEPFVPHAVIICERSIPTSITFAGLLGIDNLLRLDFDLGRGEHTFLQQALDGLEARLVKYENDTWKRKIPYFDRPLAVAVNYASDRSIVYNINSNILAAHDAAISPGKGTVIIP